MSKVLILVEGQTEETFIKRILAPHLIERDVFPIPKLATTKRMKQGPHFKGGLVSYQKAKNDIMRLLGDTSAVMVTTMLDLYGLPSDFPGLDTLPQGSCYQKAAYLEQTFAADVNHRRFHAYLGIHEFEALLFAEPEQIARPFSDATAAKHLSQIRSQVKSPEEIDEDDPPSKRILSVLPRYRKALLGPQIGQEIGLIRMRAECSHFDNWVRTLESLTQI